MRNSKNIQWAVVIIAMSIVSATIMGIAKAELVKATPRKVFLAKASSTVTAAVGADGTAFSETIVLGRKVSGGCIVVSFSTEVYATDRDDNQDRRVSFSIKVNGNPITPHPTFHQTGFIPANDPRGPREQIVTINAYTCTELLRGENTIEVLFASVDAFDDATVGPRTLVIWLAK